MTKIHAFNSIVSILAQIQEESALQCFKMPYKTPISVLKWLQLRLSNTFTHLAVTNTDVVAATLQALSVMTWMQDQSFDDLANDQDKPAQDTKNPNLFWEKISWLFATNTKNVDMRHGSSYPGPCIIKAEPPVGYPKGSDPRVNLLQYLDEFPKKWWVQSINLFPMYHQTNKWVTGWRQMRTPTFGFWLICLPH